MSATQSPKINKDLSSINFSVPPHLNDRVVFKDNNLYVSSAHIADPDIIEFEMRLMRMNVLKSKRSVTLAELQHLKQGRNSSQSDEDQAEYDATAEIKKIAALLDQAVEMSASDIHIVINETSAQIKMRIDGYLGDYAEMTKNEGLNLVRALYVAAQNKNKNQFSFDRPISARLSRHGDFKLPRDLYAARFASIKSDNGGRITLRLLYDGISSRGARIENIELEDLGFSPEQSKTLHEMADAPNGMIIIDGPTGSGKSTTLKFVMEWINQTYPHFNILTVEDPPEYPIKGSTQIPVLMQDDEGSEVGDRGREYGSVISTILRLDPDVIMVGEIRDGYSAIASLRAAQTGHRLWTTLHANDAWEALNRMIDLLREGGMHDPMAVLSNTENLAGMVAQRLVPKLCPGCKKPLVNHKDALPANILDELMAAIEDINLDTIFLRGDGCMKCVPIAGGDKKKQKYDKRHGIIGRTVVSEIVRPDQTLLDIARRKGIPSARRYWLQSRGGRLIADAAVDKIKAGIIDPQVAREFVGPLITGRQVLTRLESTDIASDA